LEFVPDYAGVFPAQQKARQRDSPAGFVSFRSLWPLSSGHGSPPAWISRGNGGVRNGGDSALLIKLKGGSACCQIFFLPAVDRLTENEAVRIGMRFTTAVALGCALWAGAAQAGTSPAQYHDRDNTSAHKTSDNAPPAEARIDINHASLEQLVKVPGMTETWARRIVRFRPYRTKIELLDKGIVTSQIYDRIKDYIIAHKNAQ
jgi:hypothetical protein